MKSPLLLLFMLGFTLFISTKGNAQSYNKNAGQLIEDLDYLVSVLSEDYVYAKDKAVDWGCLQQHYKKKINEITSEEEEVLLFEFLLDEF